MKSYKVKLDTTAAQSIYCYIFWGKVNRNMILYNQELSSKCKKNQLCTMIFVKKSGIDLMCYNQAPARTKISWITKLRKTKTNLHNTKQFI